MNDYKDSQESRILTASSDIDKSCARCAFVEREYVEVEDESLTRDALTLKVAALRVLLDQRSSEAGVAFRRLEQVQSTRRKLSKENKELKHKTKTESGLLNSYMKRLHETEAALSETRARLEQLSEFVSDEAESDCHYGDNCPSNAGTRHGTCSPCKARRALLLSKEDK